MPEPNPRPEPIKQPEAQPLTQIEKRDLATKKFIAERISPIVGSPEELKTKSAEELDQMADKIKEMYQSLTWADVEDNYDVFESVSDSTDEDYNLQITVRWLTNLKSNLNSLQEKTGIDYHQMTILDFLKTYETSNSRNVSVDPGQASRDKADLQNDLFSKYENLNLGIPLHTWLEESLKSQDVEIQAKAIYLAFKTENPFLFVHPKLIEKTKQMFAQFTPETEETEETIEKVAYFFTEVGYAAEENAPNAWGYCQETCREILKAFGNEQIGSRFFKDLVELAKKQSVLFPPQLFFILETIKKQVGETDTTAALAKFYETEGKDSGIANHPVLSKLTYIVSGENRAFETPTEEHGGTLVSLFSGPPDYSCLKAHLNGFENLIQVDTASPQELEPLQKDGRAVYIRSELLPNQNPNYLFASPLPHDEKPKSVTFIQGHLPEDWEKVKEALPTNGDRLQIEDKRGSLLYLQGNDLLKHLENVFAVGGAGTVFDFSKGISKWAYVDMMLEKQGDGSLKIKQAISGMKIKQLGITKVLPDYKQEHILSGTLPRLPIIEIDNMITQLLKIKNPTSLFNSVIASSVEDLHDPLSQKKLAQDISEHNVAEKQLKFYVARYIEDFIKYGEIEAKKKLNSKPDFQLDQIPDVYKDKLQIFSDVIEIYDKHLKKYYQDFFKNLEQVTPENWYRLTSAYFGRINLTTSRQGIFFPKTALAGFNPSFKKPDPPITFPGT